MERKAAMCDEKYRHLVVTMCTTRFNIQQFHVLPIQCIYVFCVDLRTNSDYFPVQHSLTGFYNRDVTP